MITIDLKYTLICLVLVALIVFLIMLCILVKNLITTVKKANQVVDDTKVVSKIASDKATQVDGITGDLGSALSDLTEAMRGNQNLMGAITNIAKATASTVSYFKGDDPAEYYTEQESRKWRR